MPTWTNLIPPAHPYAGVPLLRTPATATLSGHILSPALTGTMTHFAAGRTQPCEAPHCTACDAKLPYRYHGYLCILLDRTTKPAIVELTAAPANHALQWQQDNGTLRGFHISLNRPRKTLNGRIAMLIRPGILPLAALPQPIDCQHFMAQMWNLAQARFDAARYPDGKPAITIHPERDTLVPQDGLHRLGDVLSQLATPTTSGNGQNSPRKD